MNNTQLEIAEKLFMACQFDRAFPLFEELAEENNSRALFFLGVLHGYGLGHVKKDQEKSLTALEKSAVTGGRLGGTGQSALPPGGRNRGGG